MRDIDVIVMSGTAYIPEEGIDYAEVNGTKVVKLRFRHVTGPKKEGEQYAPSVFREIEAWGNTAQFILDYVKNGDSFIFRGHHKENSWITAEGKKFRTIYVCDEITLSRSSNQKKTSDDEPQAEFAWKKHKVSESVEAEEVTVKAAFEEATRSEPVVVNQGVPKAETTAPAGRFTRQPRPTPPASAGGAGRRAIGGYNRVTPSVSNSYADGSDGLVD